jgi:hypothetical protein
MEDGRPWTVNGNEYLGIDHGSWEIGNAGIFDIRGREGPWDFTTKAQRHEEGWKMFIGYR